MGFFDKGEYVFILLVSDSPAHLFQDWDYAVQHPNMATGIIASRYKCNVEVPEYQYLYDEFQSLPGDFDCMLFDSHLMAMNALNRTLSYMTSKNISSRCLERQFYFDPNNAAICQHDNENVLEKLVSEGQCQNDSPIHYGVCELLDFYHISRNITDLHVIQALNLNSYYSLDKQGTNARLLVDKYGDRSLKGTSLFLSNSVPTTLNNNSNVSQVNYEFVNVYKLTLDVKEDGHINLETSTMLPLTKNGLVFPGGSVSNLNYIRPLNSPPDIFISVDPRLRICISVLTGVLITLCFASAVLIWVYQKTLVVRTASPVMLYVILAGITLSFTCVLVTNLLVYPTNGTCIAKIWLRHLGWSFVFGPIFAKTYRLDRIFNGKNKGVEAVRNNERNLMLMLTIFFLIMGSFLAIYTIVSPDQAQLVIVKQNEHGVENEVSVFCQVAPWFTYLMFFIEYCLLFYGALLVFAVRKLPTFYNEHKIISWSIYTWFFLTSIEIALSFMGGFDVMTDHLVFTIAVLWPFFVVWICFFGKKFFKIACKEGDLVGKTPGFGQPMSTSMGPNRGLCVRCNHVISGEPVPNIHIVKDIDELPDETAQKTKTYPDQMESLVHI
eukprot:Awhi_evm1s13645